MKTTGLFACLSPSRQASDTSLAAPTLLFCGNNPDHYAKEMERHFGGDMGKLHTHVAQQPADEQKAIIDGSEALRDFLGIGNSNDFRQRCYSFGSSSSRIRDSDALTALAIVATRSGNDTYVLRALTCLEKILQKHPPSYRDSREYQQRVETAFSKLLQELHELRTEAAQQKVVKLIERHLPQLNPGAWENITSLMRTAMGRRGISNELRTSLLKLCPPRFSANKQNFLKFGKNLPRKSDAYESVHLSTTDISKLAKVYSQQIGSTIHVSGSVIPITEQHREAWCVRQEEFLDKLVSSPDAGVRMLQRYIHQFHKDKALKSVPYISKIKDPDQFKPKNLSPEERDELTKIIAANTDGIRDRLLACVKEDRENLSEIVKQIGHGAEGGAAELAMIANNTGGVTHGYIFPTSRDSFSAPEQVMPVIPYKGHIESYVVCSTGKVINAVPYSSGNGARPEVKGQYSADVTPFLIDERRVLPQGGDVECGTLGLSYLKQYLKDNAKQLNENTLLLDIATGNRQRHFHLPSPQVLKYSQSELYAKLVRAMVAGNENVVTVEHKGKKIRVITLQGFLNSGAVASRPDGMEIPGGIENFRKNWLELCDISDAKRLQMRAADRNLYTTYTSQRLEKKARNAAK